MELRRKRQGTQAGALVRRKKEEKQWRHKQCLSSMVMGNVCSLNGKMDELSALVRVNTGKVPDSEVDTPDCVAELAGFKLVRVDSYSGAVKRLVECLLCLSALNCVTQGTATKRPGSACPM